MSETFSQRLREIRVKYGKTQLDVAKHLGISNVGYGAWERGDTEPSVDNIVKLCRLFNCSSDFLLGTDFESTKMSNQISELKHLSNNALSTISQIVERVHKMEIES